MTPLDFRVSVVAGWGRAESVPGPVFVGDAVATNLTLGRQGGVPRLNGYVTIGDVLRLYGYVTMLCGGTWPCNAS